MPEMGFESAREDLTLLGRRVRGFLGRASDGLCWGLTSTSVFSHPWLFCLRSDMYSASRGMINGFSDILIPSSTSIFFIAHELESTHMRPSAQPSFTKATCSLPIGRSISTSKTLWHMESELEVALYPTRKCEISFKRQSLSTLAPCSRINNSNVKSVASEASLTTALVSVGGSSFKRTRCTCKPLNMSAGTLRDGSNEIKASTARSSVQIPCVGWRSNWRTSSASTVAVKLSPKQSRSS
mmetsp:Transcript_46929/g.89602  ORF Transcript_46929/g.89602 Transcript_46929/m.89602 type:complete len:240 (+) Transcript_46929:821-1540(+)